MFQQNVKRKLSRQDAQGLAHSHPASTLQSLTQIPEPIRNVLNLETSWDFDIFALERVTNKR